MAKNPSSPEMHLSVHSGRVTVVVGDTRVEVPTAHLKRVIKLLKVARGFVEESHDHLDAPRQKERASAETTPAVIEASPPAVSRAPRRSGRLADSLVTWMGAHPGWHSEGALLAAVVAGAMTAANPKRALKISLGRKVGDLFETDGHGHWKLVAERSAGPPPTPPRSSTRRGRKTRRISPVDSEDVGAPASRGSGSRVDRETRRVVRVKKGDRRPTSGEDLVDPA